MYKLKGEDLGKDLLPRSKNNTVFLDISAQSSQLWRRDQLGEHVFLVFKFYLKICIKDSKANGAVVLW